MTKTWCFLVASLGLVVTPPVSAHTPPNQAGAAADWAYHGGGADESGYSRLNSIKTSNVHRLGLAWSLDLPDETTLEATPLAVGGVLFFTGATAIVYAVDGRLGKLLWKFDPQTWKFNPAKMHFSFAANRGVAYANGRVYFAALDGRLFALDAKNGKLLWSVETVAAESMHTITSAPRVFRDKVIIGQGGADFGLRGYVTAYDAITGRQCWRFYLTPGSPAENSRDLVMQRAADSWHGEFWRGGTGGAVWDSISYDVELDRLYLGTGNAGPYDPTIRSPGGGDNLFTASVVALDAESGKYLWHYQVNPSDEWDYDATQRMTIADLMIAGVKRKVLMQAPKNGFFYVLDRLTGKLISAEKLGKVTWADHIDLVTGRPVETAQARYDQGPTNVWPDPTGAHSWQDMSFSPITNLVYIPYMQMGGHFAKRGEVGPGAVEVGGLVISPVKEDAQDGKGALLAWDPIRQRTAWRAQLNTLFNGGILSTAGGVVFQGGADGWFTGYDALSGQRLWQFDARLGIIGAPISYAVRGQQFIAVLAGYGGAAAMGGAATNVGWKYHAQPRRVLAFALSGTSALPATSPPDTAVEALDDPALVIDDASIKAGRALFAACALCHGRDAISTGGMAPDLRESVRALNPVSFWTIVHEGILLSKGMPRYESLSREQAMDIYAYIRAAARNALVK